MGLEDYTVQDLVEELESRNVHFGIRNINLSKVIALTKKHFFDNTSVDTDIPNISKSEMFIGMLL